MKFPSKITSYSESILSKLPIILDALLKYKKINVLFLYNEIKKNFVSYKEFIDALDCLYALNKISLDRSKGEIKYVD